jgi:hypothetical protein
MKTAIQIITYLDNQFKELLKPDRSRDYDKLIEKVLQTKHKLLDYLSNSNSPQVVNDSVNHPSHYTSHPSGIECIEITRHYCFSIGNAIKYLWRAGLKKDAGLEDRQKEIEDLKKAIWYINDRIKQLGYEE